MTDTNARAFDTEEPRQLADSELENIAGGNPGGKPGHCPACGSKNFSDLGGGRIKCKQCGWEGTRDSITA